MAYADVKEKVYGKKEAKDEPTLACSAHGCPLNWSVDAGGRLCSYHAWEPAQAWPRITDDLKTYGAWSLSKKKEVDYKSYPGHPKAWAMRLKDRHDAGEKLSKFQIESYKTALKLG